LNGIAGKEFKCKPVIKQGVGIVVIAIATDLLQSIINKVYDQGVHNPSFP